MKTSLTSKWNEFRMKVEWHMQNLWLPFYYTHFPCHSSGVRNTRGETSPVIISLTTIPERINRVHFVIERLLRQTYKPNRIILYLKESDGFGVSDVPKMLTRLQQYGLEIKWVEDLNCHTKYYFSVKDNPNAIVITVDDDGWYSLHLVEELIKSYKKHPTAISAIRVHKIVTGGGRIAPYKDWIKGYQEPDAYTPQLSLFATGCGGVLYPPNSLHADVLDAFLLKKLCLRADDVWLKIQELRYGTPVVCATKKRLTSWTLEGSQAKALNIDNVTCNRNDVYINNCLDYYGHDLVKKLISE